MTENLYTSLKCCVIVPTYNNGNTLENVLEQILKQTSHLIVVNDGSTDKTNDILSHYTQITQISYPKNKGKGYALKKGFEKALSLGYDYAITIDSDGQHKPEELERFLKTSEAHPQSIIIGARSFKSIGNMPAKNNFANNFSNFWFKIQTGIKLPDTQSGYRLYPLSLFKNKKYYSSKYEFELEVLVRAAWQGISIESIPIDAYYAPKGERISHFRPAKDFIRISFLNTVLTTLACSYYIPRAMVNKYRKMKFKDIIKEQIYSGENTVKLMSGSIAFGVFMGIIPIWGYQLALGFFLAHLLKLNKAIFFLAANISIPPMLPFIFYLSFVTGSFVLGHGSWQIDFDLTIANMKIHFKQYLIGSVVFATIAAIFFGGLSYLLLPFIIKKKKNA